MKKILYLLIILFIILNISGCKKNNPYKDKLVKDVSAAGINVKLTEDFLPKENQTFSYINNYVGKGDNYSIGFLRTVNFKDDFSCDMFDKNIYTCSTLKINGNKARKIISKDENPAIYLEIIRDAAVYSIYFSKEPLSEIDDEAILFFDAIKDTITLMSEEEIISLDEEEFTKFFESNLSNVREKHEFNPTNSKLMIELIKTNFSRIYNTTNFYKINEFDLLPYSYLCSHTKEGSIGYELGYNAMKGIYTLQSGDIETSRKYFDNVVDIATKLNVVLSKEK